MESPCLCCKKNSPNIIVNGNAIFRVCGQSDCRDKDGRTLGEWLLHGHDDKSGNLGNWYLISGRQNFSIEIHNKEYDIPVDKRVVKGLHNKIKEIMMKTRGFETDNED